MAAAVAAAWSYLNELDAEECEQTLKENAPAAAAGECRECGADTAQTPEGFAACIECGLVSSHWNIDDNKEWKTKMPGEMAYFEEDPTRCAHPGVNPELFSDNWGQSTIINTKGSRRSDVVAFRRMAKISFHQSMNHVDRALFHAYAEIDERCATLTENVRREAKALWKKFTEKKLTRGAVRQGVKANCVLFACRTQQVTRSIQEIARMFNISTKDISRTDQMFRDVMRGSDGATFTTASDLIVRLLNHFTYTNEQRKLCLEMCDRASECPELMAKTPGAVAAAILYHCVGASKVDVVKNCDVSMPTLNKLIPIVETKLKK